MAGAALSILAGLAPAVGQAQAAPVTPDTLVVGLSVDTSRFLSANSVIELALSRPLSAADGELALVVGGTDVSSLVERGSRSITYRPIAEPLPAGNTQVVVYRVTSGQWVELHRATIKVLTPAGFRRIAATPQATFGNKGQLASGEDGAPEPERPTFQDFSLNGTLGTTHEHTKFTLETSTSVMGVSRRQEALRFGVRQDRAPLLDLADYRVSLRAGNAALTVGHTSFGNSRHLVNGFGARGAVLSWAGRGTHLSVASLNATATVGWDRLLPITDGAHRMVAASIGQELVPGRPGMFRIDATWLDASMRPVAGFTQGAVVDAEESMGGSVQLSAATPGQRLRLTSGVSRSRFDNPARDGQLTGDSVVVAVERETRTARFVEASMTPFQNVTVPALGRLNLAVNARHERVDPLYRSVLTAVQADRQNNAIDAVLSLGALSGQFALGRARDNLAGIPTLMLTRDRTRGGSASLGLAPLLRVRQHAAWLPTLTWSQQRVHQAADGVPPGGVFTPDQVPNQLSRIRDAAAQWQLGTWRFQVRSNRAEQDNRQVGRTTADFASGTDAMSIGWSFGTAGDVSLEAGEDFQRSKERNERTTTRRATLNTNLRRGQSTSMVIAVSLLRTELPVGPTTLNGEQRVEVTQPLAFLRDRSGGSRGQVFLRFGRTTARMPDVALLATNPVARRDQRQWAVSSGLNLRMF